MAFVAIVFILLLCISALVGFIVYKNKSININQAPTEETSVEIIETPFIEEQIEDNEPMQNINYINMAKTITWQEASNKCNSLGKRLCNLNEYCPDGALKDPVGGIRTGDQWAPLNDAENEWVSIGENNAEVRLCNNHTTVAGGKPEWGLSNVETSFKGIVGCCNK